jgi:hypothetical protein
MTNYAKMALLSAALSAFLLPAAAQTSTAPANPPAAPTTSAAPAPGSTSPTSGAQPTSPAAPATPPQNGYKTVNQRKQIQQNRIANGVDNGSLTAGEAGSLEKKESQINQEENTMKSEDNGHLTSADRTALEQQQKGVSQQIYQDKHNAATQYDGSQKIGQRSEKQQDRIGQGIKSGQLTAGEASNLENKEAAINQEKQADRAANGGHLTQQQKNQINQQQNKVSKQIYKDKHNNKKQ